MPYGNASNLGICFQDSYGTLNTDSMHWLPILSDDVGLDKPPLISQSMRGVYDEGQHYEGQNAVTGTLNCEAHPIALGAMLTAMFGPSSDTAVGSVYQHTFVPRTDEFDKNSANVPFTFYKYLDDGGSASLFYDLNGTSLELNIANGELLMSNLGITGGKFQQISALTSAYPTGKQWTWDATSISAGESAVTGIKQLGITVSDPIEATHTLNGSKYPSRNKRTGFRTVEISGTLTFDDQAEYQAFLNQSERKLVTTLVGDTEIASGYYDTLELIVPLMRHTEFKPPVGGPGEIEVSFSSKGVYSADSGTAFQATLTNTKAAYL